MLGHHAGMSTRSMAVAVLVLCGQLLAQGTDQRFLAVNSPGQIHELDAIIATTSSVANLKFDRPTWLVQMTYSGGRVLAITNGCSTRSLVSISLADNHVRYLGNLNAPWPCTAIGFEWHPSWGRLLGVNRDLLIEIDPATAQVTVLATLTTSPLAAQCLAINSLGQAYTMITSAFGTRLFELDLQTGVMAELGTLPMSTPGFMDLAFDRLDQLWGFYVDGFAPHDDGIYRIDIPSVSAWNVRPTSHWGGGPFFDALTFVPEPILGAYCTGKTNSAGCVPSIAGHGWPSASVQEGFWVSASQAVNQSTGLLFLGAAGRASIPFAGGTFCVAGPIVRTPPLNSGGSKASQIDCTGVWRRDVNEWHMQQPGLLAGATIQAQWYGRDPGLAPPHDVSLSNALEFVLLP